MEGLAKLSPSDPRIPEPTKRGPERVFGYPKDQQLPRPTTAVLASLLALALFSIPSYATTKKHSPKTQPEPTPPSSSALPSQISTKNLPLPIELAPQIEGSSYTYTQASPLSSSSAYFAKDHILYVFSSPRPQMTQGPEGPEAHKAPADPPETSSGSQDLMLTFLGQNPDPLIRPGQELSSKTNYYLGDDPRSWRVGVPNYSSLSYEEIYPRTDAVFYTKQGRPAFDLVLKSGADPEGIRLLVEGDGLETIKLDGQGNLVLRTKKGEISLEPPMPSMPIPKSRSARLSTSMAQVRLGSCSRHTTTHERW